MRALPAAILVLAATAGCMDMWQGACPNPSLGAIATPWVGGQYLATDPRQEWQTLLRYDNSSASGSLRLRPLGADDRGLELEGLTAAEQGVNFTVLTVPPGPSAADVQVFVLSEFDDGHCHSGVGNALSWDLAMPIEGELAGPGKGAHVMTAGFWRDNGTLFYTNIQEVHDDPSWPRAAWYEWGGAGPLPVYVYDQARSEEPAYWHGTTAGTPLGAPTRNATAWDYFTTIPGFNAALKGLSTNTARVAVLSPEEAYTREGNEAHELYGASIVFFIKVLDVVDMPCPGTVKVLPCDVPGNMPLQG